jgi:hypothetical protein
MRHTVAQKIRKRTKDARISLQVRKKAERIQIEEKLIQHNVSSTTAEKQNTSARIHKNVCKKKVTEFV